MMPAIKAEFKKLLTVRSTYVILGIAFAAEMLFAFYATGWRATPQQIADPYYLTSQVTSAINALSLLVGIVSVMLITHEYRYNTIMHTLTSNNSRTKVMISKLVAVTCFGILFALFFGFLSPALTILAVNLHGHHVGYQIFKAGNLLWRAAFYGWGLAMYAAILAFVIRIQIGAIIALLLIPTLVENISGLILKGNQIYLPYSSLNSLMGVFEGEKHITNTTAVIVVSIYVVVGLIVSRILFQKRDAN